MQRSSWWGMLALVAAVGCGGGTPERCADGTWDHDGDTATACVPWTACVAGEAVATAGSSSSDRTCAPCPADRFSTGPDATACTPHRACGAGERLATAGTATSDTVCAACAAGTFSAAANATSCTPWTDCVAGEYVASAGTASGDRTCAACPSGTWSAGPNQAACLTAAPCAAGTVQTAPATATAPATCTACPAGEYCAGGEAPRAPCGTGTWDHDADPATACVAHRTCAPGTRLTGAGDATTDRSCEACPSGTFSTTANATACQPWVDCAAGEYVSTAGTATSDRACLACASGTYSASANQSMCLDAGTCAAGTVNTAPSTATSPVACDACQPGQYCAGGTAARETCSAGTWDHDANPATACATQTACLAGSFVSAVGNATTDRSCTPCGTGTFTDAPNAPACQPWATCAAGQYVATAGTASSDRVCTACAGGSYTATTNASTCTPWSTCAAGQYVSTAGSPTVDRACTACAAGTFSTAANAPACTAWTPCASGFVEATPGSPTVDRTCTPEWVRAFGTASEDSASKVAFGSDRSVVAAGSTGGDLAGTGNAGSFDAWVRKYSPTGVVLWTRQFGGASTDRASGVAVAGDGSIIVAGTTRSDLDGNGNRGLEDGYLRKFDASGTPLWTRQFGTVEPDWVTAVRVASDGRIVVAGRTDGNLGGTGVVGGTDAYVRVYDATGTHLWTRQFGTDLSDEAPGLALGTDGRVVVAGHTQGDLGGTGNAGTVDAYVRVYDATGTLLWTRQFGTTAQDYGNGVALTPTGGVVIAGLTYGDFEGTPATIVDAYVRVYDANGTHQWTRQFGSAGVNMGTDVTVGSSGRIVVAGSTESALPGATHAGSYDAFLRAYDASGAVLWTRQLGTNNVDQGYAVVEGSDGSFAVAGQTYGNLAGATNAGLVDAFVARLSAP